MAIKLTISEFIKKARDIHGNKYNYSKVKYVNTKTKIIVVQNVEKMIL